MKLLPWGFGLIFCQSECGSNFAIIAVSQKKTFIFDSLVNRTRQQPSLSESDMLFFTFDWKCKFSYLQYLAATMGKLVPRNDVFVHQSQLAQTKAYGLDIPGGKC